MRAARVRARQATVPSLNEPAAETSPAAELRSENAHGPGSFGLTVARQRVQTTCLAPLALSVARKMPLGFPHLQQGRLTRPSSLAWNEPKRSRSTA